MPITRGSTITADDVQRLQGGGLLYGPVPGFCVTTSTHGLGRAGGLLNASMVLGRAYGSPIYLPTSMTFDAAVIVVGVGAATATRRLAIYRPVMRQAKADPVQLDFVHDCGSVDATTAGEKVALLTPSLTLEPGWYFLMSISVGAVHSLSYVLPAFGLTTVAASGIDSLAGTLSFSMVSTDPWPASFSENATMITTSIVNLVTGLRVAV